MNAEQMREALYRHYAGRYAVLFEVSTNTFPEDVPIAGEPVMRRYHRRQIDMLTVGTARRKGIGPLDLLAVEIKVSRGDFLADVRNPAKQAPWREVAHRHAYAAPAGMIRPEEIPAGSGLLEVAPRTVPGYWDVNWKTRARYGGTPPVLPGWLTLTLAYRMSRAEAKLRGLSGDASDAESAEDLRGALVKARADLETVRGKYLRAVDEVREWKTAFAATGGDIPCKHCGKPVVPRTLRGGSFSTWRHRDAAHNAACDPIRAAVNRWTEIGPADDLGESLETA